MGFLFLFFLKGDAFSQYYLIDTDIGFDVDDSYALIYALNKDVHLLGVTTSGIFPNEKANITRLLVDLYQKDIPVFAGIGFRKDNKISSFFKLYPFWPTSLYGSPTPTHGQKPIYQHQAQAFQKTFPNFSLFMHARDKDPNSAIIFLIDLAKQHTSHNKLNIICLAPLNNIADAFRRDPSIKENVRLWIMGGWYREDQQIKVSYNTKMNPQDFIEAIKDGVEAYIIDTQTINQQSFKLHCIHQLLEKNSLLSKALSLDLYNWQRESKTSKINIYDLFTTYVATNPQVIQNLEPLTLHLKALSNSPLFSIFIKKSSKKDYKNAYFIKSINKKNYPEVEICSNIK